MSDDDITAKGSGRPSGRAAFADLSEAPATIPKPPRSGGSRRARRRGKTRPRRRAKSDDGDGDGDVGDDGVTKGPASDGAARARGGRVSPPRGRHVRVRVRRVRERTPSSEPSTARNARRARVRRARTSAVFPAACPFPSPLPRDGTCRERRGRVHRARISPGGEVERNRTSDEIATQTAPEPAFPRVDVPRRPSRSRRFGIDATSPRARLRTPSSSPNAGGFARRAGGGISPTTVKLSLSSGEAEGDGSTLGMRGGVSSGSRARAKSAAARRAPDFASTPLASEAMLAGLRPGRREREGVRVMKGDATVAASGSGRRPPRTIHNGGARFRGRGATARRGSGRRARASGWTGGTVRPRRRAGPGPRRRTFERRARKGDGTEGKVTGRKGR